VDAVNRTTDNDLNEEQIARYLKNNAGFFLRHEDLLMDLKLVHHSGNAVSLLERQVSLLRERNVELRQRLGGLLDNARNNDQLFEQTRGLILSLLEARDLQQIVQIFRQRLVADFNVEFASIIFFGNQTSSSAIRFVAIDEARRQIESLLRHSSAVCGVLRPEENQFLFPENADQIGSAAVMPLNSTYPLGVLAIASHDAHYFRSTMGTMFLSYLAEVLQRILPAHLERY
jgi:uncharacterized protein YigA (DUF484 family)